MTSALAKQAPLSAAVGAEKESPSHKVLGMVFSAPGTLTWLVLLIVLRTWMLSAFSEEQSAAPKASPPWSLRICSLRDLKALFLNVLLMRQQFISHWEEEA